MSPDATKTVCFDLDGTLCTNTFGDYETAEPFDWAIERLNELARAGHRIVIFTARGTATGIDWRAVTERQLERWGVSYDELRFGKPSADVYVDDRAVHTTAWRAGDVGGVPGFTTPGAELPAVVPTHLAAVVEVGRTFDGEPLLLEHHARRAKWLAQRAEIRPLPGTEDLTQTVTDALARAAAGNDDLVFTLSVASEGHAALADVLAAHGASSLAFCRPLRHAAAGLSRFATGTADGSVVIGATTAPAQARSGWPLDAQTGHLQDAMGGAVGLVVEGRVVLEGTADPPAVASAVVADLAGEAGIELVRRQIATHELETAAEAFVVGFPFCLLALGSLDGRPAWPDAPGPVTRALLTAWSRRAGVDIAAQTAAAIGARVS